MFLHRISDPSDSRLSDFVNLTDVDLRRRLEPASGLYVAESAKVIRRVVAGGHVLRSIVMEDAWVDRSEDLIEAARRVGAPIYVADRATLEQVAGYRVHRGALASVQRPALPEVTSVISQASRIVVLGDIVDHTNVGAIFRAVAGLGADAVLISPRCADPLYRRSVRVSMGAVLQVPWTRLEPWPQALTVLRERGFRLWALGLGDTAVPLGFAVQQPPERWAMVLGSEGHGLPADVLEHVDEVVRIPMHHGIDSLNVASAAAVALWALVDATERSFVTLPECSKEAGESADSPPADSAR